MNRKTNLVVLGANGGIGAHVVTKALQRGFRVTAVVRTASSVMIRHHDLLHVVTGDVLNPSTFEQYVDEDSVLISAIGSRTLGRTLLYSSAAKNILTSMRRKGANRCFFISAAGIEVNLKNNIFIQLGTRLVLQQVLRNIFDDLRRMEQVVRNSTTDWTILRPPRLTHSRSTLKYRIAINAFLRKSLSISRADVAHFIIDNIYNTALHKSTVEIAY